MPISEEKAIAILEELIRKPETKAEDVPRIWSEIISVYNKQFAPPEEPKKKRKRRTAGSAIGWPAGVSREEYKVWKEAKMKAGETEGLNPQTYRRLRDEGLLAAPEKPKKITAKKAQSTAPESTEEQPEGVVEFKKPKTKAKK